MTPWRPCVVHYAPPGGTMSQPNRVEAKVGFEPTWTALQTVASPHSATSPLPWNCRSALLSDISRALRWPASFLLRCGKIQSHGTHPAGCRQLEDARQPVRESRAGRCNPEGPDERRRAVRGL